MSAPEVVWMLCGTRTCPHRGSWLDVEVAAFNFAVQERTPVLCPGCRQPLTRVQPSQRVALAPTTRRDTRSE